jgi:hypothetical protein
MWLYFNFMVEVFFRYARLGEHVCLRLKDDPFSYVGEILSKSASERIVRIKLDSGREIEVKMGEIENVDYLPILGQMHLFVSDESQFFYP